MYGGPSEPQRDDSYKQYMPAGEFRGITLIGLNSGDAQIESEIDCMESQGNNRFYGKLYEMSSKE